MALVGSPVSVFLQQQQTQMERQDYGRTASVRLLGSARGVLTEIEEEPAVAEEVEEEKEKVYFAVAKELKEGKTNLLWVLQSTSGKKNIVIVHVHRRAQKIPMMGASIPMNQLEKYKVEAHWQREREKMNESLDEYIDMCARCKVQAEKLVIERDDVGKGLVELIAQHGITKLVMGAAADKYYSRKMKELRSKTALRVQQQADPSCKIWFICSGKLICVRDSGLDGSGIVWWPEGQRGSWDLLADARHEGLRHGSGSVNFNSHGEATHTGVLCEGLTKISSPCSSKGSVADPWEGISRSSQCSDHSLCSVSEEGFSDVRLTPVLKDEGREEGSPNLPLIHESEEVKEAENSYTKEMKQQKEIEERLARERIDMFEEPQKACEQRKALALQIMDSNSTVKDFEMKLSTVHHLLNSLQLEHEKLQRERESAVREAEELRLMHEKLRRERDNAVREAEDLQLEHEKLRSERDNAVREVEDLQLEHKKLRSERDNAVRKVEELRLQHEKLQREREDAVKEAKELHQMNVEMANCTHGTENFSEFSYMELKQATHDFDDSLKIGEGGYGKVYKGFLRHTTVAIKMLNPQSMQGQSEFHQEVDVLSRVRHPNLITLIGACPEAWALIYELLPNGSLEDRLVCRNKTTPLSWQIRARIATEICSVLIFLHSNKPHGLVHGDLKPANILLDANFTSKLGDFGVCRFLVQSNTSTTPYCHTNPKGTFAYLDPEFLTSGELTPHSDVYSFGVIILRLLTERPALGIINKVREALEKDCLDEMLDASAGGWPHEPAKQLAQLGLKCCEAKRRKRPVLAGEAWKVLEPILMKVASSRRS